MVQNCCARCMGSIGRIISYVVCCKCCHCCCCCKKKEQKVEEIPRQIKLREVPSEENYGGEYGETYGENIEYDQSIYNGSSVYGSPSVDKQPEYTGSTTSGIYTSECSATSGSTNKRGVYGNKPDLHGSRPNSAQTNKIEMRGSNLTLYGNQNEMKLELSCEIKGAMEIGGKKRPVKGVLMIVPDEEQLETMSNVHLRHKNSRAESHIKQQGRSIYNKAPRPLPRTHSNNESNENRVSEMYLHRNSSTIEENTKIQTNADVFDSPKPPLPKKNQSFKEPEKPYEPVYENFRIKNDTNSKSKSEDIPRRVELKRCKINSSKINTISGTEDFEEHIYEDIDPWYRSPYCDEKVDYEIYMSRSPVHKT